MESLYGLKNIMNIKRNHQEKYNLIFNQIIFSSNINKKSKILVIGFFDGALVQDLINRGYTNVYYTDVYEKIHICAVAKKNRIFKMIDYGDSVCNTYNQEYDLLIVSSDYKFTNIDENFDELLTILNSKGSLMVLFNAYIKSFSPVWTDIRELYKEKIPDLYDGHIMNLDDQIDKLNSMFKSRKDLSYIRSENYNWIEEYTLNEYIELVESIECYKNMDCDTKLDVSLKLDKVIDSNGGSLRKANQITLVYCSKL